MESRENDSLFDNIMLFLANTAKPFADEWFKICQWFLIIAVTSFLSKISENKIYGIIFFCSIAIAGYYFYFHYLKICYHEYQKFNNKPRPLFLRVIIYLLFFSITIMLISAMHHIASLFALDAVNYLHKKG